MTTTIAENTAEAALLKKHEKFLSEHAPHATLAPLHEAAIRRFETIGFPGRKHEMYTFVNTNDLVSTPFALAEGGKISRNFIEERVYPGCEKSCLVFVDGEFREELSDVSALNGALKIAPLHEALADAEVKKYLETAVENENDVFAAINSAFFRHGCYLEIPDKTRVEAPLEILIASSGASSPVTSHPRLFLKVGALAELKLIVRYVGDGANHFVNAVQDIWVGEDAGVTFTQVQQDDPASWHCCKTRIALDRNARLFAANASSGNKLTRQHLEAHLKAEGSELEWNAVSVLNEEEQVHHFVRIHHESPHGTSRQHFKNIVNGKSRSSVDGTVVVDPGAQQTSSDQLINNLMLSDNAHADTKPNLMIFADDVKCTHGATIGQIDAEQLFYLKTRGLSGQVAKELLTKSFAESIIQTLAFPEVAKDLANTLLKKLEN